MDMAHRLPKILLRWGVLLAAAWIFQVPFLIFSLTYAPTHDFSIHYHWVVEFADAFYGGDPYPRWMARANYGLGEPALLYYSPLYYFCTALLRPLSGNSWDAMRQVLLLSTLATGFYGHRLLKNYAGENAALFGAVCLQLAPMIQMMLGYVAEIPWVFSFPILVATLYYAVRPGAFIRPIDMPIAACICLLVMTHVLSAMMVIICFSVCFLPQIRMVGNGFRIGRPAWSWVLSVLFGLALSSVYLLPALASLKYISPGHYIGAINTWASFAFPIVTQRLYGIQWFAFQWVISGAVLLCVLVATWFSWRRPHRSDRRGRALAFLLIAAWTGLILASELSFPLWLLPAPLPMLQFPYRFIFIATAAGVLANLLVLLDGHFNRLNRAIMGLPLLLCVALTAYTAAKLVLVDGHVMNLQPDDRSVYVGAREYDLKTAGNDWQDYAKGGFQRDCRQGGLVCEQAPPTGDRLQFQIDVPQARFVRLPLFAFPAWQATVDGAPAQTKIDRGLVAVALPKGSHAVQLQWRRLPAEIAGFWLSVLSLCLGGLLLWRRRGAA